MIILSCNGISLSFGGVKILENITFNLQLGERAGLVGVNGAGKSTLFKIINGDYLPDSGEVFFSKGLKLGMLEQNSGLDSAGTIWSVMLDAFSDLINVEARIKDLEKCISSEKEDDRLSSLMKEYSSLSERFSREGGYEYNSRVRGVLRGLGFDTTEFDRPVNSLSGGQKTRLALAKLLLEEPDILLLDEPTNHLDIGALEWLEEFLKSYRKSILVISHDRYFLDAVTNRTIEIENGECKAYPGSYSVYAKQKAIDREIQQKHYEQQQREIARMEAFIEQQRRWNREKNIVAAESRQKAIDRMEKLNVPKNLPGKISIKLQSAIISGNDVLFIEELSKEFPGKKLFDSISFDLKRNERVFLLGPNGCGKSTLLKILAGRLEQTSGSFEFGHKIILGYYDQELADIDESKTVLEEVWDENEKLNHTQIRNALAQYLFTGEDVYKPISVLSGGEKSRVALVKLMLSGANFLLLDEPTNHLDINSREALEESIVGFDGTVLAVSHDRYFINKLATRVVVMSNHSVSDFKGDYQYYLSRRPVNSLALDDGNDSGMSASKLERLESKEEKARKRKLEKQLAETEKEIGTIEQRLSEIDEEMTDPATQSDHVKLTALLDEQNTLKARLDELYDLWGSLTEQQETE
jgi:ATP-binding cassette subfamily F protein 3